MALTGCHVVCAYAGSIVKQVAPATVLARPEWTETLAGDGITSKDAPGTDPRGVRGDAIFHARAASDGYGIIDPAPNKNDANQVRVALPAGEMVSVYVKKGDKLMYVVA